MDFTGLGKGVTIGGPWRDIQNVFFCANGALLKTAILLTPDVEVLGWVVRLFGCTAKFSKMMWRWLMVEKLTFKYLATSLVDIPAVSMRMAHSLKT